MKTQNTASQTVFGASIWLWLSIAAALLAIAGSIVALAVKSIYAGLTPAFLPQALAQDIANLALVAPLWLLLAALALPTNPVHILDLAFFLPAVIATGVMLIKQRPLAYTLAPTFIVFLILTGIPILLTPVVQTARGEAAARGVVLPIGVLTAALLVLLAWLLSTIRPQEKSA